MNNEWDSTRGGGEQHSDRQFGEGSQWQPGPSDPSNPEWQSPEPGYDPEPDANSQHSQSGQYPQGYNAQPVQYPQGNNPQQGQYAPGAA